MFEKILENSANIVCGLLVVIIFILAITLASGKHNAWSDSLVLIFTIVALALTAYHHKIITEALATKYQGGSERPSNLWTEEDLSHDLGVGF